VEGWRAPAGGKESSRRPEPPAPREVFPSTAKEHSSVSGAPQPRERRTRRNRLQNALRAPAARQRHPFARSQARRLTWRQGATGPYVRVGLNRPARMRVGVSGCVAYDRFAFRLCVSRAVAPPRPFVRTRRVEWLFLGAENAESLQTRNGLGCRRLRGRVRLKKRTRDAWGARSCPNTTVRARLGGLNGALHEPGCAAPG
jgi:hypothetical protein